ncbi:MFS transporter [Thiorhodovibrio frisius]|uniref:Arabinose efflux permease family protein n=1 Tax=Thiorhodovibrio frisius TaxID=631362 RepID=H8Z1N1_9GAMM|nr:MFS transporter [Thiorhodovibrio frisius]EIC21476.1 arabinose efflux permease family protein [Thiorhodovibrio frisius]WPL24062.1 enterobactin exporter EntS [Thiorhodovibrio frisius]
MTHLFSTFSERNYRLFFIGQGLSLIGYWIQSTAFNWMLYTLTDSPLMLGYLTAAINLPVLLLLPFAGALVDRFERRRLLIALQILFAVQALALAVLAHFELLTLPLIIIMGCVMSALTAFDSPSRQAIVPRLVTQRENLPAAISLNSMLFNTARSVGPPLAGWVMAQTGPAPCFLLNAVSYLFMITALLLICLTPPIKGAATRTARGALGNLGFILATRSLRYLILSYSLVAIAAMSVYVMLPVWANEVAEAGPQGLGWLMGGIGFGALAGAALIGTQRRPERLWPMFRLAAILLGLALILLALSHGLWLAMLVTVMLGMAYIAQGVAANTLLQLSIDDDHRAGVIAFYLLAVFGSIPIGNLLGGWLSQVLGLHGASLAAGAAVLVVTALFWPTSHRIIREIPPAALASGEPAPVKSERRR